MNRDTSLHYSRPLPRRESGEFRSFMEDAELTWIDLAAAGVVVIAMASALFDRLF